MSRILNPFVYAFLFALLGTSALAEPEEIMFTRGSTSAQVKGSVSGFETREYRFRASAGQILKLKATASDPRWLVLQVRQPGKLQADVFDNFISGDLSGEAELKSTGDYSIRVGLRRVEADRGGKLDYTLSLTIPPVKDFMAEAKYFLDQQASGQGTYEADGKPSRSLTMAKVQLLKSGEAHLRFADDSNDSFTVVGTWTGNATDGVTLNLSSGLGGRTLTGTGTMAMDASGVGFQTIELDFQTASSSQRHKLFFKAKG